MDKTHEIIEALNKADINKLRRLIEKGINFASFVNNENFTWCVKRNLFPEAEVFVAKGVYDENCNAVASRLAAGNIILKMLVEAGCNVPEIYRDYEKYSLYKIEYEKQDFLLPEIIYKERISASNKNTNGALWHAVSPEALKIMLVMGRDITFQDCFGSTVLHHFVCEPDFINFQRLEMIKLLIEAGANVNVQDHMGNTPLMYSAMMRNKDNYFVNKCLLEHGADLSIKNCVGLSVLDVFLCEDIDTSGNQHDTKSLRLFLENNCSKNSLNPELSKWQNIKDFVKFRKAINIYSSWEDVITHSNFEDSAAVIQNDRLDLNACDINGINFPEAAAKLRDVGLLKICLTANYDVIQRLFIKLINNYDVDGIKSLLDSGLDADIAENFSWHFVKNYIPEADDPQNDENAKNFKNKLDKGTVILNMLHEQNVNIPNLDFDGKELSYTHCSEYPVNDEETIPVVYSEKAELRRAVSPMAVAEILDKLPKKTKRRGARVNREAIRAALTPDLFAIDIDEEDNEID